MNRPEEIFQDGQRLRLDEGEAVVQRRALGFVKLTSGKLGACDPFVGAGDTKPFARTVLPGRYALDVSVLELPDGDRRVGFARLQFERAQVVRWEPAVPAGSTLADLKPGESYGYDVDAGTGCFGDISALRAFDECGEDASEELLQALDRTSEKTWSWADITCGDSGENLIAFSSGLGDGFYASFWGIARDDSIACIVTDFGVCEVDWSHP